MTIAPFDHDYWRSERDDWTHLGIAWRCFLTSCDGVTWAKDSVRRDPSSEAPPLQIREWLNKPSRLLKNRASTPADAIEWLRTQFELYAPQMYGQQASYVEPEVRFGRALHDLQVGSDVAWEFWTNGGSTMVSMAILAVSDGR